VNGKVICLNTPDRKKRKSLEVYHKDEGEKQSSQDFNGVFKLCFAADLVRAGIQPPAPKSSG
jgi:hypothetical protein